MSRAFAAQDVYYVAEPVQNSGFWEAAIMMVDATGREIAGESVEWSVSDSTLGSLNDCAGQLPPSRRAFAPVKRGECIVSATFEGETASTRVVIIPSEVVYNGQGLDLDGDGSADLTLATEGLKIAFPHGGTKTDLFGMPEPLGNVPLDFAAPAATSAEFQVIDSSYIFVFNCSDGAVYAALIRFAETKCAVTWRKLRDAA